MWAQSQVKFGRHRKGMWYRAGKKEQKELTETIATEEGNGGRKRNGQEPLKNHRKLQKF